MFKTLTKEKLFEIGLFFCYLTSIVSCLTIVLHFYFNYKNLLDSRNPEDPLFNTTQYYGFTNPLAFVLLAFTTIIITRVGIQAKEKWAWTWLFITVVFFVLPALIGQLIFGLYPFSMITLTFGIIGVSFTGPEIFSKGK